MLKIIKYLNIENDLEISRLSVLVDCSPIHQSTSLRLYTGSVSLLSPVSVYLNLQSTGTPYLYGVLYVLVPVLRIETVYIMYKYYCTRAVPHYFAQLYQYVPYSIYSTSYRYPGYTSYCFKRPYTTEISDQRCCACTFRNCETAQVRHNTTRLQVRYKYGTSTLRTSNPLVYFAIVIRPTSIDCMNTGNSTWVLVQYRYTGTVQPVCLEEKQRRPPLLWYSNSNRD